MQVPFIDLSQTTQQIKNQYLKKVEDLLAANQYILNQEVETFEKAWAKVIGSGFCVGTSSGADALFLALTALGIKAGDEVITQGNAYNASVVAILRTGAAPRFIDIDSETLTIDVLKIESLINEKTKAILPVHLYGQANEMPAIMAIAKKHNLVVIEDCAQAHLAEFAGKKAGNWGDAGCFSFYPTKNLGAFGDAGAVVTSSQEIKDKLVLLRNLGEKTKNDHQILGFNMRLDSIQAICLNLKLVYLEANNASRRQAALHYDQLISQAAIPIKPVSRVKDATHVYHLYVVKSLEYSRDQLKEKLAKAGIQTAIHYPVPVYRQPFYQGPKDDCPATDEIMAQIISLPMFVGITRQQQEYVVSNLKKIIEKQS